MRVQMETDVVLWHVPKFTFRRPDVALGDGLPLFAGLTTSFVPDLVEAQAYAGGSVLHVCRPAAG